VLHDVQANNWLNPYLAYFIANGKFTIDYLHGSMLIKLKNQLPGVQLAVFFALAAGMFLLNMAITDVFFGGITKALTSDKPIPPDSLGLFKWVQFINTFLVFLVPSVLYGYFSDEKPLRYIGLRPGVKPLFLLITLFLLMAVQPLAMVLGQMNQQVNFGETVRKLEELSEKVMTKFLVMDTPGDLAVNMLIVAVLPAIAEELFFRGCFQNILERLTRKPVVAIIVSSFLFGFFHFTFSKFLPIFLLGMVLGTLFFVTRNIWYSIFFHFLNNALALLANYYAQHNEFMKKLASDDVNLSLWVGVVSLAVTLGIFYLLRKKIPFEPLEETWKRDHF
jgi:uncharacterized protein